MPNCLCPEGRAYFESKKGRNPWAVSTDRVVPGREGGRYIPENVRLAHWRCNQMEGSVAGAHAIHVPKDPDGVCTNARKGGFAGGATRAKITNCGRWRVARGKPCICGYHESGGNTEAFWVGAQ